MSEPPAETADSASSTVGWLDDERAHAVEDTERVQRRIDRLQARVAATEVTQDPDIETSPCNDRCNDEEDDKENT